MDETEILQTRLIKLSRKEQDTPTRPGLQTLREQLARRIKLPEKHGGAER
jgi:hypothetical protein